MGDKRRIPTISGGPFYHGPEGVYDFMHPRTYSEDSGYRSRASSKTTDTPCNDHERHRGSSPLCLDTGLRHNCTQPGGIKSKQDIVVRNDTTRYRKARGGGPQVLRSGANRHTEVATHPRDHITTVAGILDISIGKGTKGQRDSGFLSSLTLAGEDYDAKWSPGFPDDALKTNTGHAYKSSPHIGPVFVDDGYTAAAGGEKSELRRRGEKATERFAENSKRSQAEGSPFPDSRRPIKENNRRNCKSLSSLSELMAARHDQSNSSWFSKSGRDIRSEKGSDYHIASVGVDNMNRYPIDTSVDSVLSRLRNSQSVLSPSSVFENEVQAQVDHGVYLESSVSIISEDISITVAEARTERTLQKSSIPDGPLDKLFIRKILNVAGMCIFPPVVFMPDKKVVPIYSPSIQTVDDVHRAASQTSLELEPCFTERNVKLEKKDFLEAFNRAYRAARLRCINTVGRVIQMSNFAGAMLDSQGGCLSIDDLDVHLYVPCGAVPKGPPQLVYIFVEGNLSSSGDQLTPCVHCGPSTLRFRKDVILTFPHCAKDPAKYHLTFTKSKTGGYVRKIQDIEDGVIHVGDHSITMTMDHFCGYSARASVSIKNMLVCVFINEDAQAGQATIRLRLLDDIKSNLNEVKIRQSEFGFYLADPVQTIEIKRTGGDVQATLTLLSKSWEITGPACGRKTLNCSRLWQPTRPGIDRDTASILFHASCKYPACEPFRATTTVYQGARDQDSVEFVVKKPACSVIPHPNVPTCKLMENLLKEMLREMGIAENCNESMPLTEGIYRRLCNELDVEVPLSNWRYLPEHLLGLNDRGNNWVRKIEMRAKLKQISPSELVLDAFFAESKSSGKDKADTLMDLKRGLLKLNREDLRFAISAIDDQLCCEGVAVTSTPEHEMDPNNNSTGRVQESKQGSGGREELASGYQSGQQSCMPVSPKTRPKSLNSTDFPIRADQAHPFNDSAYFSLPDALNWIS